VVNRPVVKKEYLECNQGRERITQAKLKRKYLDTKITYRNKSFHTRNSISAFNTTVFFHRPGQYFSIYSRSRTLSKPEDISISNLAELHHHMTVGIIFPLYCWAGLDVSSEASQSCEQHEPEDTWKDTTTITPLQSKSDTSRQSSSKCLSRSGSTWTVSGLA
jgi:hypothetical protein